MVKLRKTLVDGVGDPCHRCGYPTEIHQHLVVTQKRLNQPFYYSRWFYCANKRCRTTLIMPEKFKIYRHNQETWEDA